MRWALLSFVLVLPPEPTGSPVLIFQPTEQGTLQGDKNADCCRKVPSESSVTLLFLD